jgi:hypothetical protein
MKCFSGGRTCFSFGEVNDRFVWLFAAPLADSHTNLQFFVPLLVSLNDIQSSTTSDCSSTPLVIDRKKRLALQNLS